MDDGESGYHDAEHWARGLIGRFEQAESQQSCPDATLEMPNGVIVIEGKRTEATTTSKTTGVTTLTGCSTQ